MIIFSPFLSKNRKEREEKKDEKTTGRYLKRKRERQRRVCVVVFISFISFYRSYVSIAIFILIVVLSLFLFFRVFLNVLTRHHYLCSMYILFWQHQDARLFLDHPSFSFTSSSLCRNNFVIIAAPSSKTLFHESNISPHSILFRVFII